MTRLAIVLNLFFVVALGVCAAEVEFDSIIELKLTLPKDTFMRGSSDPVADLNVEITLTNKTAKENLVKEKVTIDEVSRFTSEELGKLRAMTADQQKELLAKKTEKKELEVDPINGNSTGYAHVEPQLGPIDTIEFVIVKLPDEGETVPEGAMPTLIRRDNLPDQASFTDLAHSKYVAAGETSPAYKIPVGKFYVIRSPGLYSIRAVMKSIPDRKAASAYENTKNDRLIMKNPGGYAVSNEEKFRVLPFKIVDAKIEDLKSDVSAYERGYPDFDYMMYQVKADANFDAVYALQRIPVRGVDRWEWTMLCTVKTGTTAQVVQVAPKKVALLAVHGKGDAGLYNLDFTAPGVKIEAKPVAVKDGAEPKLKNEGGTLSVE
ncbi:MAG: hypothetical protein WCT04_09545 [Planctomycetota bacterium]